MITELLLAGFAAIYVGASLFVLRGILRNHLTSQELKRVSVVVPVRNEEHTLAELLDSLILADYPSDMMEIIVVDDQSTDRTRDIALSYGNRFSCPFHVLEVTDVDGSPSLAKTRPLAKGLDHATGDLLLMTDADCVVPRTWIRSMTAQFSDSVGMVCGITVPNQSAHVGVPLTWYETMDWLLLMGVCSGFAGRGEAQALIGNNYAIRASTYRKLGGFRNLSFQHIDDIALMLAVREIAEQQVVMPAKVDLLIFTRPVSSLWEMISQRRRWMAAWPHTDSPIKLVMGLGFVAHLGLLLWSLAGPTLLLLAYLVVLFGDGLVIGAMTKRIRMKTSLIGFLTFPAFVMIYGGGVVLQMLFKRTIQWKGRKFN